MRAVAIGRCMNFSDCTHLQSPGKHGSTVWQDRDIQPGRVWYADIEQAMAACGVALLRYRRIS